MKVFTKVQHMGVAALIMAISIFFSRFMGLIRDKVISYYYGATLESDVYFASFVIPDFINYLLAGGYFSITLIPLLSRLFAKDEEEAWRFFSSAIIWVSASIGFLTLLAWIFANPLAALVVDGFKDPEKAALAQVRLVYFLRIILPAQICFLTGACFTAILYFRRQFVIPALTPLIYNGCIILTGVIFIKIFPERGMEGFCWGVLLGAALGSFLLPVLAVYFGGLKFRACLYHPALKKFILLAIPLMLGQSIVALDEQFVRIFGSSAGEGAISLLNYARRIMLVPVGVVAQAAGVASFPFLASLVAKRDKQGFDETVNKALLASVTIILPIAIWMMVVSEPTIRLIFQQGKLGATEATLAGNLLAIMLCSVGFWGIQQVLGRGFYAHENTITPVVVGSFSTLLALPLYWYLGKHMGAVGIAIASTASMCIYTVAMLLVWKKYYGSGALAGLWRRVSVSLFLALPAAALSFFPTLYMSAFFPFSPIWGAFFSIAVSGACFAMIYIVLGMLFAPYMIRELLGGLFRRWRRKTVSK